MGISTLIRTLFHVAAPWLSVNSQYIDLRCVFNNRLHMLDELGKGMETFFGQNVNEDQVRKLLGEWKNRKQFVQVVYFDRVP